jgi:hypothetical protein
MNFVPLLIMILAWFLLKVIYFLPDDEDDFED